MNLQLRFYLLLKYLKIRILTNQDTRNHLKTMKYLTMKRDLLEHQRGHTDQDSEEEVISEEVTEREEVVASEEATEREEVASEEEEDIEIEIMVTEIERKHTQKEKDLIDHQGTTMIDHLEITMIDHPEITMIDHQGITTIDLKEITIDHPETLTGHQETTTTDQEVEEVDTKRITMIRKEDLTQVVRDQEEAQDSQEGVREVAQEEVSRINKMISSDEDHGEFGI